jgi:hypothetical protein
MNDKPLPIFLGDTNQKHPEQSVTGGYVSLLGEDFYKIHNYDAMEPFFMSLVSGSNHWLFISSTGGLTAGRVSAEQALFPYYTEDKLAENSENTGNRVIFLVTRAQRTSLWEPFSTRQAGVYVLERSLYKNVSGTALVFEEVNHDLKVTYRYAWRTSDAYGFVKTGWLHNLGDSACQVEFLDGLQNLLPANISSTTQNIYSPLLDAYKRSELEPQTGLGIFALNSTLTDLAEPSESLLATTVMQLGLDPAHTLLSSAQLDDFRAGRGVTTETEVRGRRGAYFVHARLDLAPHGEHCWHLVAEVCQDSAAIVRLSKCLKEDRLSLAQAVEDDIAANKLALEKIVAGADGAQLTNDRMRCANHFANVLFNEMRGGVFVDQYLVQTPDLVDFVAVRNPALLAEQAAFFSALPAELSISELQARAQASGSVDLLRLCHAYLPLSFSRRHGDPSRPWNRFAIHLKRADGSRQLGYEGNWRDIFQNWEALAYSYPEYIESMICTFLNATTLDGYNPYRITRQGIDWEIPDPGNPWANIGYWSDHQVIYLLKLMEVSASLRPGRLQALLARAMFSYANVPYRLKAYADVQNDPYNTIVFDRALEQEIENRLKTGGTDGKLVQTPDGKVLHATLAEKLLTLLLAKLVNFVPEGGIWMNTQRPEWNDANNALVGKGLSVVTLCYLRRSIVFTRQLLEHSTLETLPVSREVQELLAQVSRILLRFQGRLKDTFSDADRRLVMDALGQAGSDYRQACYARGFSGELSSLPVPDMLAFLDLAQQYADHSLRANKRSDDLYHAYNILHLGPGVASIGHLYEMLEGQVAILSSGMLSGAESLALLESMRHSKLFREDQHSYILYPDRHLPGFLEKNFIPAERGNGLALARELAQAHDQTLFTRDEEGNYHFSGHIHNAKDVRRALRALESMPRYAELVKAETAQIEALFEELFTHDEFTGRSGTFFAYEGLGSIYWHMVSKLMLAVQETIRRTRREASLPGLLERYADLGKGQAYKKTPAEYGAFPTDPYSHTPKGRGAQQPGMTGMVKEEILIRQAELGTSIEDGKLAFDLLLFDRSELLTESRVFTYWAVDGQERSLELLPGSLAYTLCQVPVVLHASNEACITVHLADGSNEKVAGHVLDAIHSGHIFQRNGVVDRLEVTFTA